MQFKNFLLYPKRIVFIALQYGNLIDMAKIVNRLVQLYYSFLVVKTLNELRNAMREVRFSNSNRFAGGSIDK